MTNAEIASIFDHVADSGDEAAFDQVDASGEEGDAEADCQLGRAVK